MSHLYAYDFGAACSKKENATSSVNHDSINSSSSSYMQDSPVCNRMVYGQDNPPAYKLSAITTPIALFTGGCKGGRQLLN